MARAIDVDRVKREIRKNKEKIVISCKQKYVPLSLIYEILNKAPTLTPPNEWVSVEDRLPASGQNVIATNGSDVGEAWYASLSRSWYRYNGLEWNRICREVTHWMPLPEAPDSRPPEGEEGDANCG